MSARLFLGSRRHLRVICVLLAIGSVAASLQASTAAARPRVAGAIVILRPGRGAVLVGPKATMHPRVRVARGVGRLRFVVVGPKRRDVTGRFHRKGRVWSATLRDVRELRRGRGSLLVRGRYRGRAIAQSVGYVVVDRRASLLRVSGLPRRRASRPLVVGLRTDRRVDDIKVTVNGHSDRDRFTRVSGGVAGVKRSAARWQGRLSADDGLRFGANRVVVVAYDREGLYQRIVRTFTIKRDRPLVGAGRDQLVRRGRQVTLDATNTKVSGAGRTRWHWQIISRPKGSHVRLHVRRDRRPRFRPDRPGTYRIRLTVAQHRRRRAAGSRAAVARSPVAVSSDVTTVTVAPDELPQGTRIHTMVSTNGQTGITVGSQFYPMQTVAPTLTGVQILALNVSTLQPLIGAESNTTVTSCQAFSDFIAEMGDEALLIISAPNGSFPVQLFGVDCYQGVLFGGSGPGNATGDWNRVSTTPVPGGPFSAVTGTDGRTPATLVGMRQTPGGQVGSLNGYLASSASVAAGQYPADHVFDWPPTDIAFNTHSGGDDTTSNTMTIAGTSYPSSTLTNGASGFQIVSMDAASLGDVQQTTVTSPAALSAALAPLEDSTTPRLVFITSIGRPDFSDQYGQGSGLVEAAHAIAGLGGTQAGLLSMTGSPNSVYSFVGATGIGTGSPGSGLELSGPLRNTANPELEGVVSRSPAAAYQPAAGAGAAAYQNPASLEPDLNAVLAQPTQQWPAFNTPAERAAEQYVAQQLDLDIDPNPAIGIRASYWDPSKDSQWGLLYPKLQTLTSCSSPCTTAALKTVVGQLQREFYAVAEVRNFFGNYSSGTLYQALNSAFSDDANGFAAAENAALKASTAPPQSSTGGFDYWDLAEGILWSGSAITGVAGQPELSGFLALSASAVQIASVFANTSSQTTYTGATPVYATASQLGVTLTDNYEQTLGGLDRIADLLVSDPGRLAAAANKIEHGTWAAPKSTQVAIEHSLNEYIWQTLLSTTYQADDCTVPDPYFGSAWNQTDAHTPTEQQFTPLVTLTDFPSDPITPAYGKTQAIHPGFLTAGQIGDDTRNISTTVQQDLFSVPSSPQTVYPLGLIPQYFFIPQGQNNGAGFTTSHGTVSWDAPHFRYRCAGNQWSAIDINPPDTTSR